MPEVKFAARMFMQQKVRLPQGLSRLMSPLQRPTQLLLHDPQPPWHALEPLGTNALSERCFLAMLTKSTLSLAYSVTSVHHVDQCMLPVLVYQ